MTEILDTPAPAITPEPAKPATTPAPVGEPTSWMGNTDAFRDGAPEKVTQLLEAKKWTNAEQIVDGYLELEKFKGIGDHLVIPEAEDADGWNDVYQKLGRPETFDKYEITYDGDVQLSDELTGSFKEFAHGMGLTQKQFDDIVKFQIDAVTAQEGAYTEQIEATKQANIEALKQKYGVAFESKVQSARQTADRLGIYETIEAKGLASDPDIIDMLATIAGRTAEDVITPQTPTPAQKTPQEELNEIKASSEFTDKFNPKHKEAVARFMQLNQEIARLGQTQAPRGR